jgi:hypothetical protein
MATARQRQDKMNYENSLSINVQPKDPSKRHFYISLIKSAVRMVAGASIMIGGYYLGPQDWGLYIMIGGALLILAEVLGVLEEL